MSNAEAAATIDFLMKYSGLPCGVCGKEIITLDDLKRARFGIGEMVHAVCWPIYNANVQAAALRRGLNEALMLLRGHGVPIPQSTAQAIIVHGDDEIAGHRFLGELQALRAVLTEIRAIAGAPGDDIRTLVDDALSGKYARTLWDAEWLAESRLQDIQLLIERAERAEAALASAPTGPAGRDQ